MSLNWNYDTARIGGDGISETRTASEAECSEVSEELGVIGCHHVSATYKIKPISGNRFLAQGEISADIEQACVVTLDPVAERLSINFSVEFRPSDQIQHSDTLEFNDIDSEDPEPIENGQIRMGRFVYELIASHCELYPRSGEETLDGLSSGRDAETKSHPFADLARLKSGHQS
ncbi:MAG: YceD family protein [Hyphomicrobiaceae bacterium]